MYLVYFELSVMLNVGDNLGGLCIYLLDTFSENDTICEDIFRSRV